MNKLTAEVTRATAKDKKYKVILFDKDKKVKTLQFGAKGMSDFTIHKDPERKGRYLDRHKNDGKAFDTNGFWA